jgi:hypothetical protein
VITNDRHAHHIIDNTLYNHYSLLRTIEQESARPTWPTPATAPCRA